MPDKAIVFSFLFVLLTQLKENQFLAMQQHNEVIFGRLEIKDLLETHLIKVISPSH